MADDIASLMDCPICFIPFRDPRMLQCGHSFCMECIQGWMRDGKQLLCPECRLPHENFEAAHLLPRNVSMKRVIEGFVNLDLAARRESQGPSTVESDGHSQTVGHFCSCDQCTQLFEIAQLMHCVSHDKMLCFKCSLFGHKLCAQLPAKEQCVLREQKFKSSVAAIKNNYAALRCGQLGMLQEVTQTIQEIVTKLSLFCAETDERIAYKEAILSSLTGLLTASECENVFVSKNLQQDLELASQGLREDSLDIIEFSQALRHSLDGLKLPGDNEPSVLTVELSMSVVPQCICPKRLEEIASIVYRATKNTAAFITLFVKLLPVICNTNEKENAVVWHGVCAQNGTIGYPQALDALILIRGVRDTDIILFGKTARPMQVDVAHSNTDAAVAFLREQAEKYAQGAVTAREIARKATKRLCGLWVFAAGDCGLSAASGVPGLCPYVTITHINRNYVLINV